MSVCIKARSVDKKLESLWSVASRWIVLVRGFSSPTFKSRVNIGVISVHVSSIDETTDDNHSALTRSLHSRIPPTLLQRQHTGLVIPLTCRGAERICIFTWIEHTN